MQLNWIDSVIVLVILYYLYEGWLRGSFSLIVTLLSFLGSLWLAVRFHTVAGDFLGEKFSISPSWTSVIGYIGISLISQTVIEEVLFIGVRQLPDKLHHSKINKGGGALLSAVNGLLIIAFILLFINALPLRGTIKRDIETAPLANAIVTAAERYGGNVTSSVSKAAQKAVRFLTVEPGSKQQIPVDVPSSGMTYTIDGAVETQMVALVNTERVERGLSPLTVDTSMREVAREKSRDMFVRRYFSHYDPDGKNASDRMNEADIAYMIVGENLAYAPDLESAHAGLMESEGHRENILETRFHRIGIGVIDGGIYGKMFTQIFAD